MRLLERIPDLPHGEGEIDAHNSGGEHAVRYSGIEHQYNSLRRAELTPLAKPGVEMADIVGDELQDMMLSDRYEVIVAQQFDVPNQGPRLAGMAIGERKKAGDWAMRMTVNELVVHPELRRRHIASYMLGRLTENLPFGAPLTEMVVSTKKFIPEGWFIDGLESAGFQHTTRNGSPALWLPGQKNFAQGNLESPDFMKDAERHMPDNWNGYREFAPEGDTQVRLYREGQLTGIMRPIEETSHFDHVLRERVTDYVLSDRGDSPLDTVQEVTEKEALIALLNNYDQLDAA